MALTQISTGMLASGDGAVDLNIDNGTFVVDVSTSRVGIGSTTVNRKLEVAGDNNGGAKANYIRITDTDTTATANNQAGGIEFFTNDVTPGIAASIEVLYAGTGGGGELTFNTNASSSGTLTEALRIDESGNLMVGKTTSSATTPGHELKADGAAWHTADGTFPLFLNRETDDGELIRFRKDNSTVGSIGTASSDLNIDGGASHSGIRFQAGSLLPRLNGSDTDGTIDLGYDDGTAIHRFKNLHLTGVMVAGSGSASTPSVRGTDTNTGLFFPSGGVTAITRNGVEGARMDANGDFCVGRTSQGRTGNGHSIRGGDSAIFSRDSTGETVIIARNNTPGPALRFDSNGANIGGIGTHTTGGVELYMGNGSNVGFRFEQTGADRIEPCVGLGQSGRNNAIDLGIDGNRWRTVFCTTVNESSDRTLKQDIEALSDAEQRVAVAAKSLLRKYRFISDVEQDDNRYSFGIIAQDLQAAFAAEGLDAANYKMWNEATFTDETTGEEKTQQSIVYSQLLAFIISAI